MAAIVHALVCLAFPYVVDARHWSSNASRLAQVIEAMGDSIQVVDSDIGTYNQCHQSYTHVLWFYMRGHIRSFHMHANNWRSFLFGTSNCWFVSIFTHNELDQRSDTARVRESLMKKGLTVRKIVEQGTRISGGTNVAFASSKFTSGSQNTRGSVVLGREVALIHKIPLADNDVVVLTRPDLVFTHSVNGPRLHDIAKKVPYVLMPHHESSHIGLPGGGNDPSEMFVLGVRSYWESMCIFENKTLAAYPDLLLSRGKTGCLEPNRTLLSCGFYAPFFIHGAWATGYYPFFYFTKFEIRLHRITGVWSQGVMRQMDSRIKGATGSRVSPLRTPDSNVVGNVDLTRGVKCAMQNISSCRGDIRPPASKCWGQTVRVEVNPKAKGQSGGLWVCARPADVDVATCTR